MELSLDPSNPLPFAKPPKGLSSGEQRLEFDFICKLGQLAQVRYPDDQALTARIKSYELAFRMQAAVPEVFHFQEESKHVRDLYGLDNEVTKSFGERCLTARRLNERGVRFVQVYHGGGQASEWDVHSELQKNHSRLCAQVDKPIAGLLN